MKQIILLPILLILTGSLVASTGNNALLLHASPPPSPDTIDIYHLYLNDSLALENGGTLTLYSDKISDRAVIRVLYCTDTGPKNGMFTVTLKGEENAMWDAEATVNRGGCDEISFPLTRLMQRNVSSASNTAAVYTIRYRQSGWNESERQELFRLEVW